ncbi:MAG: hypothetical protein K0S40_643 [Actinomycetospora sp.]|jgi:hypothetical protein|nr:hypothetical protein [Actinomycetospora sp.]
MWVWREDQGSGGVGGGGWRLDAYGTWVWDEASPLDRPGAGIGALRGRVGDDRRPERPTIGDRALATLDRDARDRTAEPTPIFHELTVDRSRSVPRRRPARRDAVHVPEPHPGSGALPVQDGSAGYGARRGLQDVPTVPPPAWPELGCAPESPEDELRRRAERRRRPLTGSGADAPSEGGRHTWRREEVRTGRHALRR